MSPEEKQLMELLSKYNLSRQLANTFTNDETGEQYTSTEDDSNWTYDKAIQNNSNEPDYSYLDNKEEGDYSYLDKYDDNGLIKDDKERINDLLKTISQVIGGTGGALAGTAAGGPLGAVVGGGLGYGIGSKFADIVQAAREGKTQPPTLQNIGKESLSSIGDVLAGSGAEMGGQIAGPVLGKVGDVGLKGLKKVSRAIYNVPEKATEIFYKRPEAVEQMVKTEPRNIIENIHGDIIAKRDEALDLANTQLTNALNKDSGTIRIDRLINIFKNAKKKIDVLSIPEQRNAARLDDQIALLENLKQNNINELSIAKANELKRQTYANAEYIEPGMASLGTDTSASRAFREAGREIKNSILNNIKNPKNRNAIENANEKFEKIFDITKDPQFKSRFEKESNIETTLSNLQSETGNKTYLQNMVNKMDDILGTDLKKQSEDYYAQKYIRSPDLFNGFVTGRSPYTTAMGGIVGGLTGDEKGAMTGAAIGAGLASPYVYRMGIPLLSKTMPAIKSGLKAMKYPAQYIEAGKLKDYEENKRQAIIDYLNSTGE